MNFHIRVGLLEVRHAFRGRNQAQKLDIDSDSAYIVLKRTYESFLGARV